MDASTNDMHADLIDPDRRNHALRILYRDSFPAIRTHIQNNQGSTDDALDIFQEAVVVLIRNIKTGKFRGDSKVSTYLHGIAKLMWLQKLRKQDYDMPLPSDYELAAEEEEDVDPERNRLVASVFSELAEDCQAILKLIFYDNMAMEKAAEQLGFKSQQIARNKKYKCMKRLKALIDRNPVLKDKLKNLV